ncbi:MULTISPECIES: TraK domain-containing protein [Paraburkholderia]|uniref:Type-F conjugative transfer system secretin TraK n=1 Tax=Paraburkholderia madseniana TaxID=2599607 RepID=A0AAP5EZC8_9BURK|nr:MULTISPECIES: type-F conjugative transfer system secretin TraK [Paraburkholderia]MCX4151036.1 type-F conjugative transfer system secretin TraK [Paraburkholderia madseniana]MCX4176676.1 type-F conjugative transfer system secretin TraK [Paraburkholderia madseniana]MDN7153968.1 type-F conjugative transfer system secretin TraK [Paraburkholderia sp. WS6]MDQ6412850.1 type-F conjugative transfer system secretin TraK [Paraburkholderia madseniana]MDQ6464667.1 type-F conjugative transfer system secre
MKRTSLNYLRALVVGVLSPVAAVGIAASPSAPAQTSASMQTVAPAAVSFGTGESAGTSSTSGHQTARAKSEVVHRSAGAKPYDPLALNPTIAVKDTPAKEIDLPGVMKVEGQSVGALDPTRAHPIPMTDGGVVTIYMSVNAPNRIELPFKNPHTIHRDTLQVDKSTGQNIYVYWKSLPATEETLYIEPPGGGPVLGLDIKPKEVPAQTYIVTDDSGIVAGKEKSKNRSDDYIGHVQDLMESVALGHAPDGYASVDIALPPIVMDGLAVMVAKRYSSREGDLYVYGVRNPSQSRAVLNEQEFDGANVLAVSIFPKPVLLPGEQTRVIVLARKREEQ